MPLSTGQCATLACIFEATAAKPGNVHRGADFEDLTFADLMIGAVAIGPAMDRAASGRESLGRTVYDAIAATRHVLATNTNLGTVLLIAPLAMVARDGQLDDGVASVLASLESQDARLVYEAIRMAGAGGLGQVEEADVSGPPPEDLIAAMRLAAKRDLVARQYADGFGELLGFVVPQLGEALASAPSLADAIVRVHLQVMSEFPDSLIARKCGEAIAREAAARARAALESGDATSDAYRQGLGDLDFWLRADGHRRNPGTTADMIAAGLFVLLRDGIIEAPYDFYH